MHELLDIDGRVWLTLKTLITKPGGLTQAFSQGRRVTYTPPLRLYLVISILFFIIFSSIYHIYAPDRQMHDSMGDYYAKAMFVLFPCFALLVQLFYQQSFYINNLVFSMHIHSVVYLALLIIAPLEAYENQHITFLILQVPPVTYLIWYIFTAFKVVYEKSWLETIIKASAIYLIYMGTLGIMFDIVLEEFLVS